ncbi:MAG: DUF4249 domain-containing protein [Balneolales bacterium]
MTNSSCEMTVDLNLPEHEPQLVVNSYFGPGYEWEVDVTSNNAPSNPGSEEAIENATVKIYKGDSHAGTLIKTDERYRLANLESPESGRRYSLRVEAPGYKTLEATDIVPEPAQIQIIQVTSDAREVNGNNHTEIQLQITSDPETRTYFLLNMNREVEGPDGTEPYLTPTIYSTSEPVIAQYQEEFDPFESSGIRQYHGPVFFTNELFSGPEKTITLYVPDYYTDPSFEQALELQISHLSESYFQYEITRESQSRTGDNPFAEPVSVYSNLSNGMGIFGAFNETRIKIE